MITVRQNNLLSKSKLRESLSHPEGRNPLRIGFVLILQKTLCQFRSRVIKGELSKTILGSKKTPQPAIRIPIFFVLTF